METIDGATTTETEGNTKKEFALERSELLTGKTPFQDLVQEYGSDISRWVRAVREEETESGEETNSSGNEASDKKLGALLSIAKSCLANQPKNRPVMREVLKMVREARAKAPAFSSNSSDHSPGDFV